LGTKPCRLFYFACSVAGVALTFLPAVPARADFFDDARKTFTSDIPHFFQDDIPCFFGGQPTSGTRKSCKSPDQSAKPATAKGVGSSSNTAGGDVGSPRPSNSAQ
jgi:hypothetical protein